jgi:hypothetical protein
MYVNLIVEALLIVYVFVALDSNALLNYQPLDVKIRKF